VTPRSELRLLEGDAGRIEVAFDWPASAGLGAAIVGHPHPLYGGTLDNKVAATLARAFASLGYVALRPNFRGVGRSEGVHDDGRGETDDFLRVVNAALALPELDTPGRASPPVLALAGFSFGSFVAAQAAQRLAQRGRPPRHLALVGTAAGKWPMPEVPAETLLIHGENDDTIPLADVLDWARPAGHPVIVIPGADHFFHGRLTILKTLLCRHVLGSTSAATNS